MKKLGWFLIALSLVLAFFQYLALAYVVGLPGLIIACGE